MGTGLQECFYAITRGLRKAHVLDYVSSNMNSSP